MRATINIIDVATFFVLKGVPVRFIKVTDRIHELKIDLKTVDRIC